MSTMESSKKESGPESSPKKIISRKRKLIYAIFTIVSLVLFLELALRLVIPSGDRYFHAQPGERHDTEIYTFVGNQHGHQFLMPKPKDVYRVFIVGESAAEGYPSRGFSEWMRFMLSERSDARKIEVINTAISGMTSTRIRSCYFESLNYEPDLIIIYLGNNDPSGFNIINPQHAPITFVLTQFVRNHSRILAFMAFAAFQLLPEDYNLTRQEPYFELSYIDEVILTKEHREKIRELYQRNLTDMTLAAVDRGAAVILSTPAVNLKYPPLKPAHYVDLSRKQKDEFNKSLEKAKRRMQNKMPDQALIQCQAALSIDDDHAGALYLKAEILASMDNAREAFSNYQRARDMDDFPLIVFHSFKDAAKKIQNGRNILYLDIEQELLQRSNGEIPGFELFYDHVHLTPRGNFMVASVLIECMAKNRLGLQPPPPVNG